MAGLSADLLRVVDARIKARQQAAAIEPAARPPVTPEATPYVVRQEKPLGDPLATDTQPPAAYVVRGAGGQTVADQLAQRQQQVEAIRKPEWWADGIVGGSATLGYGVTHLLDGVPYDDRMAQDPIYRELRRATIFNQLQTSLREAAAFAAAGNDDMARLKLQHADLYRRRLEAVDGGKWALSRL